MSVTTFAELKIEFGFALERQEDSTIEISSSFAFLEPLPSINHGHKITISSPTVSYALASMNQADEDFVHFNVLNGCLILQNVTLCGSLNDSELNYGGIAVGNHGILELNQTRMENLKSLTVGGIWVKRNGQCTMSNSTIQNCRGSNAGAIWIEEGGRFILEEGSLIQNSYGQSAYGSQISVYGEMELNGGRVCFTDGDVYNGIHLGEEAKFQMIEGSIDHCLVGIQVTSGSQTTIMGGEIAYNEIGIMTNLEGRRKQIELHGGDIHDNRMGIELNEGFEFLMTGGRIYNHLKSDGAGILGIYGHFGHFLMTGGEIFHNIQGICWQQNTLECEIRENALLYENGYGILVDHATISVTGGKIYGNRMPTSGLAYGGIGIFVGYFGVVSLDGGDIYGNQYQGLAGHYWSTIHLNGSKIYNNGQNGIKLLYSQLYMNGGEVFGNGDNGVLLDRYNYDEPHGSYFEMNNGQIYGNSLHGICLNGISRCQVFGGKISGNNRVGIQVLHQTEASLIDGEIEGNYIGIEITGEAGLEKNATATVQGGRIYNNTVGIMIYNKGLFNLEEGEIFENYGTLDQMPTVQGGIGVWVNGGRFMMNGGSIHHHQGFPGLNALIVFGQFLGAAVCLFNGNFEMLAGSITDNSAHVGAALCISEPVALNYARAIIHAPAYFNGNRATGDWAYHYSGGLRHVDSNYAFSHTSISCHILNNYDVNYTSTLALTMKYTDYFPDVNFANVVFEQLDREWEAYIDQCEFSPIYLLDANDKHIRSIEGVQYLMNLSDIKINDNHIFDLGPLGYIKYFFNQETLSRSVNYEAHRQWRFLPNRYVSHQQPHAIYEPTLELLEIEIPSVAIELEALGEVGEELSLTIPFTTMEIQLKTTLETSMEIRIPSYEVKCQLPEITETGIDGFIDGYTIQGMLIGKSGASQHIDVLPTSIWLELITETTPHLLRGEIPSFFIQMEAKTLVETKIHKYNGRYFHEQDPQQKWWKNGTHALVWWEGGRNFAKWEATNFDGYVFQKAIPIPINTLFPDPTVALKIAKILHKNVHETIDITELLRVTILDFSKQPITSIEGLQFLFNLQKINLRGTGISLPEAVKLLNPTLTILTD